MSCPTYGRIANPAGEFVAYFPQDSQIVDRVSIDLEVLYFVRLPQAKLTCFNRNAFRPC